MASILNSMKGIADSVLAKGKGVVDNLFPPEKRAEWLARIQQFVVNNPKLSGFLLTNIALSGVPLFLFIAFTLTVFVFSLVAALLVGLLVALAFTVFMVGVALLFVFPTVFFTTLAASFIFLWGLGGYYIVKWFNESDGGNAPKGSAIGDKLNSLTGGRLDWVMNATRANASGEDLSQNMGEKHGAPKKLQRGFNTDNSSGSPAKGATDSVKGAPGHATGAVHQANGHAQAGVNKATKATGTDTVTKRAGADNVTKKTGNVTSTANTAVGGAKGFVGGATGLT